MQWYLLDPTTNQPVGPYHFEDIKTYIKNGQVSKDILAVREGDNDWKPLCDFMEFRKPETRWGRAAGIGCLSALGAVVFLIILVAAMQDNNNSVNTSVVGKLKDNKVVKSNTSKVKIPKFHIFEDSPLYEIGGMARAVQRIEVLDNNTNKTSLIALLMERYKFLKSLAPKYNSHVTNVFIYVYDSKATCEAPGGGGSWICMLSKTGAQAPIDISFNQERLNAFLHPR